MAAAVRGFAISLRGGALMQEAPNFYKKDEQQERGNYDSAKCITQQSHLTNKM